MSQPARYKYLLQLPMTLNETAARLAREDGVSLNQWISSAVAQKIGAVDGSRRAREAADDRGETRRSDPLSSNAPATTHRYQATQLPEYVSPRRIPWNEVTIEPLLIVLVLRERMRARPNTAYLRLRTRALLSKPIMKVTGGLRCGARFCRDCRRPIRCSDAAVSSPSLTRLPESALPGWRRTRPRRCCVTCGEDVEPAAQSLDGIGCRSVLASRWGPSICSCPRMTTYSSVERHDRGSSASSCCCRKG